MTNSEKVLTLQKNLLDQIRTFENVSAIFATITLAEFPYCDDVPAIHINILEAPEQVGYPAIGKVTRRCKVRVYVMAVSETDLEHKDSNLWEWIVPVEKALKTDRYCGLDSDGEPLCNIAVTEYDIKTVPSPVGTPLVGVRVIEFNAELVDNII
jgi:hypothetical protein